VVVLKELSTKMMGVVTTWMLSLIEGKEVSEHGVESWSRSDIWRGAFLGEVQPQSESRPPFWEGRWAGAGGRG